MRYLTPCLLSIALSGTCVAGPAETAFSHGPLEQILHEYVDEQGLVDYGRLLGNRATLDTYIESLAALDRVDYSRWPEKQRVALLLNAYQAYVLRTVIDHYPIKPNVLKALQYPENSIEHIANVRSERRFTLMGTKVSLEDVLDGMLRNAFDEPRIHMVINCAWLGGPPLRREAYTADRLDAQLDDQSRRVVNNAKFCEVDRGDAAVYLSPIFKRYGKDFTASYQPAEGFAGHDAPLQAVLNFLSQYLEQEDADFLRQENYKITWLDEDLSLNEQTDDVD